MTRKKFKKTLMYFGYSRNEANEACKVVFRFHKSYEEAVREVKRYALYC